MKGLEREIEGGRPQNTVCDARLIKPLALCQVHLLMDNQHQTSPIVPPPLSLSPLSLSVCIRRGALLAQSPSISLSVCCAYPVASRAPCPCFTIGAELGLHGGFHGAHTTTLSLYWPLLSLSSPLGLSNIDLCWTRAS